MSEPTEHSVAVASETVTAPSLRYEVSRDVLAEVVLAALPALRCITDGAHRCGCSTYDGAQVRERLRLAVLALKNSPEVSHA